MSRVVMAVVSLALVAYSYFEVKADLPSLTAAIPTDSAAIPVPQAICMDLRFSFAIQLLLVALFLIVGYIVPESAHFGWWSLGRYTPKQRERILPKLRELIGVLTLLISGYFAAQIHLVIRSARSYGLLLPRVWLQHLERAKLYGLVALLLTCAIVIFRYLKKFEVLAGEG